MHIFNDHQVGSAGPATCCWIRGLLSLTLFGLFAVPVNAEDLTGTYRIKARSTGRFLHVDGGPGGDLLASTRMESHDDFTRFVLTPVGTGFYTIHVKAGNAQLRVADQPDGDKLASIRPVTRNAKDDPLDRYGRFLFKKQQDGSYRIRLLTASWLRIDDKQLMRAVKRTIDDSHGRFELVREPADTRPATPAKKKNPFG